ncbi:BTB/POZ domain family protein [Brugia pahangi]
MTNNNVTCLHTSNTIALWTIILLVVPNILNCISILLLILISSHVKRFKNITEEIASNTNWLARTARRASFGPTAKLALLNYATYIPEIKQNMQIISLPSVQHHAFQAAMDSSTIRVDGLQMLDETFSQRTQLRQFELVVEKKSIFVNAHYLAELSPYFKVLCFDDTFREAQNGRAEIEDEAYDEVIELLRFICPNSDYVINRNVTENNFSMLTHFSNLMQLRDLRRQLEGYVENEVRMENYRPRDENLVEMITEAMNASFSPSLMDIMYQKLARIDLNHIKALIKNLPDRYAHAILEGAQKFFRLYPMQLPYRSSYSYDQFQQGIF